MSIRHVIAETETSTYHYHLRLLGPDGINQAGLVAICGAKVGWDTQFPLSVWGLKDHVPSRWCEECTRLFAAMQ